MAIGIDIGSVSTSLVVVEGESVTFAAHRPHHGDPAATLSHILKTPALPEVALVGYTSSTPAILSAGIECDGDLACILAVRALAPDVRSLLVVGGEKFRLFRFSESGEYRGMTANSSCAAGTGSFLDQQARRLGLTSSAELAAVAAQNRGERPPIASRCAVFAKTDLIHRQQEGYALSEICDGLCYGLARNVADTLFGGAGPEEPLIFGGGVALNEAVRSNLEDLTGATMRTIDASHVLGAVGAALNVQNEHRKGAGPGPARIKDLIRPLSAGKRGHYAALSEPSDYPDFSSHDRRVRASGVSEHSAQIEVDVYEADAGSYAAGSFLGIDIGSTSTKAVLINEAGCVLAAFYTATGGKPLPAVRALFSAMEATMGEVGSVPEIVGTATTGSGRKFIGTIVGADVVVDEITAHARAAVELSEDVDTIIEIGGQDSKFTTVKSGSVTFSQMNTVCAAGTGSFLEEQAARVDASVEEYGALCIGVEAPLTSDRCTVFMERDINELMHEGYAREEVLTAAVHAVRENYLSKVAASGEIGDRIVFQGATAKNRALVAAFEHSLDRPVHVSRYCHVTGALGAALIARESVENETSFRGTGLWRTPVPVETEICSYCRNHCRIRVATVGGTRVAYGFLCGRDYEDAGYVKRTTSGYDLLRRRRQVIEHAVSAAWEQQHQAAELGSAANGLIRIVKGSRHTVNDHKCTIGIPSGLHLYEDIPFWRVFFEQLGHNVMTLRLSADDIQRGKAIQGAEFCFSVAAFHGQCRRLLDNADILFVPAYRDKTATSGKVDKSGESSERKGAGMLCYYSQYASVLASPSVKHDRVIAPLLCPHRGVRAVVKELTVALRGLPGPAVDERDVAEAFRTATIAARRVREGLRTEGRAWQAGVEGRGYSVVLFGRPYAVLQRAANKRIPELLDEYGVCAAYQDMLPGGERYSSESDALLSSVPWYYAEQVLSGAVYVAGCAGLYPVLITSFKCSPDSFIVDCFKRLFESVHKPYLILQLDEHDSSVGYETRIEAALRSFENHAGRAEAPPAEVRRQEFVDRTPPFPRPSGSMWDGTVLFPNWDPIVCPLLAANLRRHGVNAHVLEETPVTIRESMGANTGQCLPVNIITHEVVEYVRRHSLPPERTVLWMIGSTWSCNISRYPNYIRECFIAAGEPYGRIDVAVGDITHVDVSPAATVHAYFAYMLGGLLRRLVCRLRPYERVAGATDRALGKCRRELIRVFETGGKFADAAEMIVKQFSAVDVEFAQRPKVAIFGDIYVRDNDVFNQDLIRVIEQAGGEVVCTPYNEYVKIMAPAYFGRWRKKGELTRSAKYGMLLRTIRLMEKRHEAIIRPFTDAIGLPRFDGNEPRDVEAEVGRFGLSLYHEGESFENVLKILHLVRVHDDLALFVQASPAFCCPSLVTEAMGHDIERITGVPVVTVTYDGTGAPKNGVVVPYVTLAAERGRGASSATVS